MNFKFSVSDKLSAADLWWWRIDEPNNPMVINSYITSDGVWTPADIKNTLQGPVSKNRRLRSIPKPRKVGGVGLGIVIGALLGLALYYFQFSVLVSVIAGLLTGFILETLRGFRWKWVEFPNFDIDQHIKLHVLEKPTMECLLEYCSKESSKMLPSDKPVWSCTVIHNTPNCGSAIFFRIHHVIGDGGGLSAWFMSLCSLAPGLPQQDGGKSPRTGSKSRSSMPGFATRLWIIIKTFINTFTIEIFMAIYTPIKIIFLPKDSNSPFKGPHSNRKIANHTLGRLRLNVEEIKTLGKQLDSSITVNDVLCTLLAGGFRRYFKEYCHLHPEQMAMRVSMPINTRLPWKPVVLENAFTVVFKTLPIHIENPRQRLANFHRRMAYLKLSPEPTLAMQLMRVFSWLPFRLVQSFLNRYARCSSAVVTNVMGPPVPVIFSGQKVKDIVFWVPQSGDVGLGISIASYCGEVVLGFVVDEALVPDLEPILKYITEEWESMKSSIGGDAPKTPVTTDVNLRGLLNESGAKIIR